MLDGDRRLSAYLWSWRVYSVFDDYLSKRPEQVPDLVSEIKDRPTNGDSLTIRFGALPPDYYAIRKQVGASLRALLGVPSSTKISGAMSLLTVPSGKYLWTPCQAIRGSRWSCADPSD